MQPSIEVHDHVALSMVLETLLKSFPRFPEEEMKVTYLNEHPFRIPVPHAGFGGKRSVVLLGNYGATAMSVDSMSTVICSRMRSFRPSDHHGIYLRINRCEVGPGHARQGASEGSWTKYDLFFEFGSFGTTFLCGGCNNYSGTGGTGGQRLENVFQFAAAVFAVPILEQIVPRQAWIRYKELLDEELLRQYEESRE